MERDSYQIISEYKDKGYKYLGWLNWFDNQKARDAYCNSKQREEIKFGRCLSIVLLHDTKEIVQIDSGD